MDNIFEPKSKHFPIDYKTIDFKKYISPINFHQMPMDIITEESVFKAVQRIGVDVDKDELIRALEYDRNQFAEGYTAGVEFAQPKWISVKDKLPETDQCVMFVDDGEVAFRIVRGWALPELIEQHEIHRITHWMPLPTAPKEI